MSSSPVEHRIGNLDPHRHLFDMECSDVDGFQKTVVGCFFVTEPVQRILPITYSPSERQWTTPGSIVSLLDVDFVLPLPRLSTQYFEWNYSHP